MRTQVFISYAKEDSEFAVKLNNDLTKAGVNTWFDKIDLIPGQNWELKIAKAIKESRYFIAILSSLSVQKKGFVQKEIRQAIRVAQEYPPHETYIIPCRIDNCEPDSLGLDEQQWTDFFPDYDVSFRELIRVFNYESVEKKTIIKTDSLTKKGLVTILADKGFGFIGYNEVNYFFHMSELTDDNFEHLKQGDLVAFKMAETSNGLIATSVARMSKAKYSSQGS
jgi:cold shock CspA family protein